MEVPVPGNSRVTEAEIVWRDIDNAIRARALPRIADDQTRVPDHLLSGPELPADEEVQKRFFGED